MLDPRSIGVLSILWFKNESLILRKIVSYVFIACSVFFAFAASNASEKVALQLAWKHQFQFAGYYAALHKGYYKQVGLEVTIIEGGEGKFAREELLEERAQYGIAGSELLLHRKDGEPFVVLAPIFQHSPSVLLIKKDSGILNLQDLVGKRVMLLSGKKDADILAAFLNEGISLDSIQRLDQSYNLNDLIEGRIDAVSAYKTNEPWHLLQKNIEPAVISPETYGVDFYSDCLFTTENEIKKHSERVKLFLEASLQGWEYAMDHPEEIIDILLNEYGVKKERDHLKYEADSIRKIMRPEFVQIGHMNAGRWLHIAKTYEKLALIEPNFPLDGFLYAPNPEFDLYILKKIVSITIAIIILLSIGTGILLFFNRKLTAEINQRKKAEKKLRENEKELQRTLDATADGIWSWNFKTDEMYFSPKYYEMLGYKPNEFPAKFKSWVDLIHPEDKEKALEMANEFLRKKPDFYKNKFRLRTKQGRYLWIKTTAKVVERDEKGDAVYMIGNHVDITKRNKMKMSLIQSESLFRGLYDNMTSGSAIYEVINDGSKGSDYIIKNFNKKSLEIEKKSFNEVVGKSLFDLRPNIDDYGLISVMKKVWETGESAYFPIKIYHDDVFSNYYENYIFKIPTGEVVTIYNDITDQKNSEIALIESEKRFSLAMKFANDGIFDWNLKTNKIYYSPGWKRMLGYEDDELPNDFTVWESLTEPEDVKRSWKMQNELINKKRDRFEMEFKMKHKNGHWVDILSRANAIFDKNNKAVRIIGTHVDISGRKKLENQLLQSRKFESIGSLAGGIAHEFNNILSIIIGNNEIIIEDLPEWSFSRENCEEIHLAGLRARDIVKQLLTFSRQDDSTKKPINMVSVVTESLKLIRSTTPTNIEIRDKISPNCLSILGDATQINQILINLCNNAIDALPISGGIIDIELCNSQIDKYNDVSAHKLTPGKYIKLMVRDNGSGISQKIFDRIFEPYFTTKDVGKGSGIGLAVVHGIVENHGGSIVCESSKDQGTIFTILIPAHERPVEEESHKLDMLSGNGERILYVDDEPLIAKLGRRHLESLGYDAYSTTDPEEALEMIKAEPDRFNLIVSDMAMPNMPGDQLIAEILSINSEMPTMICSGYSSRMSETKASEMGIKAFVMKPMKKAELAKKVREVLDGSNQIKS